MRYIFPFLLLLGIGLSTASRVYAEQPVAEQTAALTVHSGTDLTESHETRLRKFLEEQGAYEFAENAGAIVNYSEQNGIDWALIPAIAGLESSFCKHIPTGSYNCWGWGIPTGAQSGIGFSSFEDGIKTVSEGLRKNYINKGRVTIEQIGSMYAASPTWAIRVRLFVDRIHDYTPDRELVLTI